MNGINRIRLKTEQDYYNSGVMLMDLEAARVLVQPEAIFQYVRDHENELLPQMVKGNDLVKMYSTHCMVLKPCKLMTRCGTMTPDTTPATCCEVAVHTIWTG